MNHQNILPGNLTNELESFCQSCDLGDLELNNFTFEGCGLRVTTFTLTCKHLKACGKWYAKLQDEELERLEEAVNDTEHTS